MRNAVLRLFVFGPDVDGEPLKDGVDEKESLVIVEDKPVEPTTPDEVWYHHHHHHHLIQLAACT